MPDVVDWASVPGVGGLQGQHHLGAQDWVLHDLQCSMRHPVAVWRTWAGGKVVRCWQVGHSRQGEVDKSCAAASA